MTEEETLLTDTDLELSDELEDLLGAGRKERPAPKQVRSLAAALGVPPTPGGGGGTSAGPGGGAGGPPVSGNTIGSQSAPLALKFLGGLAAAALIVGGGFLLWPTDDRMSEPRDQQESALPAPEEPVASEENALRAAMTGSETESQPRPEAEPREAEEAEGPREATPRAPALDTHRRDAGPRETIDPEDDIRLLQEARRRLSSSPTESLSFLRRHRRLFPRSLMTQEREVLEIDALTRLGRRGEAGTRAERFRERWPRSGHIRRVDRIVGSNGAAQSLPEEED